MSLENVREELQRITELTRPELIQEAAENLLANVTAEIQLYEEWNERKAMAEEAWALNGQQLVADLCGSLPF